MEYSCARVGVHESGQVAVGLQIAPKELAVRNLDKGKHRFFLQGRCGSDVAGGKKFEDIVIKLKKYSIAK